MARRSACVRSDVGEAHCRNAIEFRQGPQIVVGHGRRHRLWVTLTELAGGCNYAGNGCQSLRQRIISVRLRGIDQQDVESQRFCACSDDFSDEHGKAAAI